MRIPEPLAALGLALLAACGGEVDAGSGSRVGAHDPGPGDPGRVHSVDLRPLDDAPPDEPQVLVLAEVAPGLAGWEVEAEVARVRRDGEAHVLHLAGLPPRVVRRPVDLPFEDVDRVELWCRFGQRGHVEVALVPDDGPPFVREQRLGVSGHPQHLTFDLPPQRRRSGRLREVRLTFADPGPVDVLALRLLRLPPESLLPSPRTGAAAISLDNDARDGIGLPEGHARVGTARVPAAGAVLELAAGFPRGLFPGGAPRVRVGLRALEDGGAPGAPAPLELDLDLAPVDGHPVDGHPVEGDPHRWHVRRVDLSAFAGRTVELRFDLEAGAAAPALAALATPRLWTPREDAPCVVLVTSDTHRADHLGSAAPDAPVRTPALDRLAARGVRFADAWSTTNITSPSHTALMTGLSPRDTRLLTNEGHLSDDAATLAEAFRAAGWSTVGVVSVRHLGARGVGLAQGFDRLVDPPGAPWSAERAVDEALAQLEAGAGRPTFLWLHLFDAHAPYEPPGEYDRLYYPADRDPFDPARPAPDITPGTLPWALTRVRDLDFPAAQYGAEVTYLDAQLARLLDHPRARAGWTAFTSDHGETLHGARTHFNHAQLRPSTLHVPLLLAGPGVAPAAAPRTDPVRQHDLGRTLLDLAGLAHAPFPGRNLLAPAEDPDTLLRFAIQDRGVSASVRQGPWFLLLNLEDNPSFLPETLPRHSVELFRVDTDPRCTRDLAAAHPERARALRAHLVAWLLDASPTPLAHSADISPEALQELQALGYSGETTAVRDGAWFDPTCACAYCAAFER